MNWRAVDEGVKGLKEIAIPPEWANAQDTSKPSPEAITEFQGAPDWINKIQVPLMKMEGGTRFRSARSQASMKAASSL